MKLGARVILTRKPVANPHTPPSPRAQGIASRGGHSPFCRHQAATVPQKAITAAEGQIDAARRDHETGAKRDEADDDAGAQNVGDIAEGEEIGRGN